MEKPWKVILAFVGVFIAGSVFGGLLALRLSKREQPPRYVQVPMAPPQAQPQPVPSQPQPQPPQTQTQTQAQTQTKAPAQAPRPNAPVPQIQLPPGMAVQVPQLMRRYVDRLDLTAEQKERVHPLIVRATNDLRRQQQTNLRETGIIIQHLQEDIAKELTPAQRGLLDEMAERQRQIIEERERAQKEKQREQQAQKPPAKETVKPKPPAVKPIEDGN